MAASTQLGDLFGLGQSRIRAPLNAPFTPVVLLARVWSRISMRTLIHMAAYSRHAAVENCVFQPVAVFL